MHLIACMTVGRQWNV